MAVIVVAPDSYKGSLSADAVARAIEAGIRRVLPRAVIHCLPMADGGEGTIDAVLAAWSGDLRQAMTADALARIFHERSVEQRKSLQVWPCRRLVAFCWA